MKVYTDAQIRDGLSGELGAWSLQDGRLCRTYRVNGWKSALILANAIGHLAEIAWHHPDLKIAWGKVEVSLTTHSENGITDKDFALAREIEKMVGWSPSADSCLEGTPGDERYRYIL